ncbi:properdin-like isoform X2 [Vanacampus margaritifer]
MENINKLLAILVIFIALVYVEHAQGEMCFARFERSSGSCDKALGDINEEDCCLNPHYAFLGKDGTCQSCGPPAWSNWSPWSPCTTLCGDGVTQRRRKCFSIGESECHDTEHSLETKPCNGTCCYDGWSPWLPWSSCSLTCGGVGVRKRARVCSAPPECMATCAGEPETQMPCDATGKCPVHGGWTSWSSWSSCSHECVLNDAPLPSKQRHRSCSHPVPSKDTTPPGDACPGNDTQLQSCTDIPNCPDDGNWSGWSHWTKCSASCIPESGAPVRTRKRSCSSPSPSLFPAGKDCPGTNSSTEACIDLPHCAVDGAWGPWSAFSACPVTCGVGVEVSDRSCDSPPLKHGGRPCDGDHRRTRLCNTKKHCPVDGVWAEWSAWDSCTYAFKHKDKNRDIRCKQIGGSQTRVRSCLHKAHGGDICGGNDDTLSQLRGCYDVSDCYIQGNWEGWEPWSLCKKVCGQNPMRTRRRKCSPDYSQYRPTIGNLADPAVFVGMPLACGNMPPGFAIEEIQPCVNVPACAHKKHDDNVCMCSQ